MRFAEFVIMDIRKSCYLAKMSTPTVISMITDYCDCDCDCDCGSHCYCYYGDDEYRCILLSSSSSSHSSSTYHTSSGFTSPTSIRSKQGILFPELLQKVAETAPDMRIRFMSPHPKVDVVHEDE